jgi:DNA primase
MQFSEDYIEKVREANDVVELIGRHTVFKQGGRSMMGLCPFPDHSEKSPSFSVSQDKQLYHCFGCGKSGNIYSFLRDYYGYSFVESIEYLAKKAGVPLPTGSVDPKQRSQTSEKKKALGIALEFYRERLAKLNSDHEAVKYLNNRGMGDRDTILTLNLGWAPDTWSELTDYLDKRGVPLGMAADLGLLKRKKEGNGFYDLFRGRVMFPVFSFSGEVLGFGGRVLGDEKPKYLNSPESSFFKKSKILYGQNWASPSIRQNDEALIVEGYTDWISMYLADFKNALGTMGTALTSDHAKQIKRWCSKVICIFDGDEAGRRASERALTNLFNGDVMARGVFLPDGSDPDSYIKNQGAEAFSELLKNSEDLFVQLLDQKLRDYSGKTHEKIEVLNWAVSMLVHLDKASPLFAIYLPEIDSRLRMGLPAIKQELRKAFSGQKPTNYSQVEEETEEDLRPQEIKKVILAGKKNDPEYILFNLTMESSQMRDELLERDFEFTEPGTQQLWGVMAAKHGQSGQKSVDLGAHLASYCSNPEALTLTLEKPYSHLTDKQKNELFQNCLKTVEKKQLAAQAKLISKNIGQDAADTDLEEFMELQRKKRKILKL